jgi:hypothetical protein
MAAFKLRHGFVIHVVNIYTVMLYIKYGVQKLAPGRAGGEPLDNINAATDYSFTMETGTV